MKKLALLSLLSVCLLGINLGCKKAEDGTAPADPAAAPAAPADPAAPAAPTNP